MSSGIGILNRTYDNLQKRVARVESQLGRPRASKYGTTDERINYAAPVEGVLWWDTTKKILYVWYNLQWILAKGIMVGQTTERLAFSPPHAGAMWWDTDESRLYVWGISNNWDTVGGFNFGTRDQRDAGAFAGCLWMCTDEGFAYAYHPLGYWVGIGDSVSDIRFHLPLDNYVVMGHGGIVSGVDKVYDIGRSGTWSITGTVTRGQDGLVPYMDFSGDGYLTWTASLAQDAEEYTIMMWFMINNYAGVGVPQPLVGKWLFYLPGGGAWLLYVVGSSLYWGAISGVTNPAFIYGAVETNKWHLAVVRNGYVRLDDSGWSEHSYPVLDTTPGYISYCRDITTAERYLDGKVSMFYMCNNAALSDAQIDFYYERTRRLHGK